MLAVGQEPRSTSRTTGVLWDLLKPSMLLMRFKQKPTHSLRLTGQGTGNRDQPEAKQVHAPFVLISTAVTIVWRNQAAVVRLLAGCDACVLIGNR